METLTLYRYGIIEGNQITLFNDSDVSFRPLTANALENVSFSIDDKEILHLQADLVKYDLYFQGGKIWENEWESTPHPKEIKEGKKHWWSKKTSRYVRGPWVRTIEKEHISYLMSNFKIEIKK